MKKKFLILIMLLTLIGIPKIGINEVKAESVREVELLTNYDTYYGSNDYYSNNTSNTNYDLDDFKEALQRDDVKEAIAILLAAFAGVLIVLSVISLGLAIYMIVVWVKIYKKAGKKGWAAIVPFYNMYVLSEFTWGKGWYAFIYMGASLLSGSLDSGIDGLIGLGLVVVSIMTLYKLAKAFGKGGGFTCGLIFLNPIFMGILAFSSKVKYVGVNGNTSDLENNATGANYKEENTVDNSTTVNANYTFNQGNQTHFCPYCGSSIDDSHTFCGNCGKKVK